LMRTQAQLRCKGRLRLGIVSGRFSFQKTPKPREKPLWPSAPSLRVGQWLSSLSKERKSSHHHLSSRPQYQPRPRLKVKDRAPSLFARPRSCYGAAQLALPSLLPAHPEPRSSSERPPTWVGASFSEKLFSEN